MTRYRELARLIAANRAEITEAMFETLVETLAVRNAHAEFNAHAFVAACGRRPVPGCGACREARGGLA